MASTDQKGTLLLEIILVTFLFGILGTGLVSTIMTSSQASKQGTEYIVAAGYIKEGIEAVRSIRDQDWSKISNGTHGLTTANGYYEFSGSSDSLNGGVFTRTITIEDVYRDGGLTGDIAASGTLDSNSKRVTVSVAWNTLDGKIQNIDSVFYVMNWGEQVWLQDLTADWIAGSRNSVQLTAADDGEITLNPHDPDWNNTYVQYSIDMSGSGDRKTMYFDEANDILYTLASNTSGDDFEAYDMSDVSSNTPTKLGGYDIQNAKDFVVLGGYAYIATKDNSKEVDIVDVSTFTQVATIDLTGKADATSIAITGNTLIIGRDSSSEDELWFYDVSVPSSPTYLRSTNVNASFNDLAANTTYVFGSSDNNSKEVFAFLISDGSQVGTIDMDGNDNAKDLHLDGNNLYVVRDDGSSYDFALVDVSAPNAMSVTSSIELGGDLNDVDIDSDERYAFVATEDDSKEIIVIDLSTFTEETSIGTTGDYDAESVEVYGGHLFVGSESDNADLMVVSVSPGGWSFPSLIASADKSGNQNASAIFVSGNYAYLVTDDDGSFDDFYIYDISTPSSPTYLGSEYFGNDMKDVVVSGDYAYIATKENSKEVVVVDISTKSSPTEAASFDAAGKKDGLSVAISGSTLFLGRDNGKDPELYSIDISNPTSPVELDSIDFSDDINSLAVSGNYLYAATDDNSKEFVVFDVSDVENITELGSYDTPGDADAISIAVSGTTAAIGRKESSDDELFLFDISMPSSVSLYDSEEIGDDIEGVDFDGSGYLYIAGKENNEEFQRWDITTPASMSQDSVLDLDADATDVDFYGAYAFISSKHDSQELQIVGQGSAPSGYTPQGTFTSQAYDAGSAATWGTIAWTESGTGNIEFRIRTAGTQAGLGTATWVGSDGTSSTVYSTSGESISVDPGAGGTQWIQFKAYLTGDTSSTPVLEDVSLTYSP